MTRKRFQGSTFKTSDCKVSLSSSPFNTFSVLTLAYAIASLPTACCLPTLPALSSPYPIPVITAAVRWLRNSANR